MSSIATTKLIERYERGLTRSNELANMRILFAVGSWGLGHATRDLPLIERLLSEGSKVTVVSTDRALTLLKRELGTRCEFMEWPDLPKSLASSAPLSYAKFTLSLPLAYRAIIAENYQVRGLLRYRRFDRIVSDNRYGIYSKHVDSFQLVHGLRFIAPKRYRWLEIMFEFLNWRLFGPVKKFLVPDFENNSLAGDLSHGMRFFDPTRVEYLGILSGLRRMDVPKDVDYFITVSGPEPQRTVMERLVLQQATELSGRVVIALGKPESSEALERRGNIEVHHFLNRRRQQELMNRAKMVICRSGYTTLMELAELGKLAMLVPTPGQTEQEYLARYHHFGGRFYSVTQQNMNLKADVDLATRYPGYNPTHNTEESVARFIEAIS